MSDRPTHVMIPTICFVPTVQVKLDGPDCDYEGAMEAKRRLARQIFDAAGHKSMGTQAYKVRAMGLL